MRFSRSSPGVWRGRRDKSHPQGARAARGRATAPKLNADHLLAETPIRPFPTTFPTPGKNWPWACANEPLAP
jgi:hypothetical protein